MDKTKFFTEASEEDMQRGITDFGAGEIPDDSTFFMPEGGGGFVGRAKGWERSGPYVACRDAVGRAATGTSSTASPQLRSVSGVQDVMSSLRAPR